MSDNPKVIVPRGKTRDVGDKTACAVCPRSPPLGSHFKVEHAKKDGVDTYYACCVRCLHRLLTSLEV